MTGVPLKLQLLHPGLGPPAFDQLVGEESGTSAFGQLPPDQRESCRRTLEDQSAVLDTSVEFVALAEIESVPDLSRDDDSTLPAHLDRCHIAAAMPRHPDRCQTGRYVPRNEKPGRYS
jgi:hypothetical protein